MLSTSDMLHSDIVELTDELVRRNAQRGDDKVLLFEEFILEALSGDL